MIDITRFYAMLMTESGCHTYYFAHHTTPAFDRPQQQARLPREAQRRAARDARKRDVADRRRGAQAASREQLIPINGRKSRRQPPTAFSFSVFYLSLASPQILRPGKNAGELAFFSQLIRIFGCALDTPARQCSNKNLTLPSLIRIFVLLFYPAEPRRPVPAEGDAVQ